MIGHLSEIFFHQPFEKILLSLHSPGLGWAHQLTHYPEDQFYEFFTTFLSCAVEWDWWEDDKLMLNRKRKTGTPPSPMITFFIGQHLSKVGSEKANLSLPFSCRRIVNNNFLDQSLWYRKTMGCQAAENQLAK